MQIVTIIANKSNTKARKGSTFKEFVYDKTVRTLSIESFLLKFDD